MTDMRSVVHCSCITLITFLLRQPLAEWYCVSLIRPVSLARSRPVRLSIINHHQSDRPNYTFLAESHKPFPKLHIRAGQRTTSLSQAKALLPRRATLPLTISSNFYIMQWSPTWSGVYCRRTIFLFKVVFIRFKKVIKLLGVKHNNKVSTRSSHVLSTNIRFSRNL